MRLPRWLLRLAPLAVLAVPLGWWGTDHLESDDAFCVSCHLPSGTPLHRDNAEDFAARPPVSLAVAHAAAGNEARPDGAFRCIDCHGGTGLLGRARVKLLSARDAFWYVTGRFEEPDGMRWPLRDADCRRCHTRFDAAAEAAASAGGRPPFHSLPVHNRELGVACVACHRSHERGGLAGHDFILPGVVRGQCARCHPELEEGM